MGSAGESDRKRRQFSSISLTAAAAKKPSLFTEDKKLDATVLQYQNQKLVQKLEVQKAERLALENKLCQLNERQQPYGASLVVVNKSWKVLVGDLESCSHPTMNPDNCRQYDSTSSMMRDQFLSRLIEMGATQSGPNEMQEGEETFQSIRNILCKLMGALNDLWHLKDRLHDFVSRDLYEGSSGQKTSCDLVTEIENLRLVLLELHLKHKSLSGEMQNHRDGDAKNKAALQRLRGELESSVAELGESNSKLVTLKAEMDESRGGVFSFMNLNSKHTPADRNRDKQKDSHDTDSALEELLDQASFQLVELKGLHEERIGILKNISTLQNTIKSFICVYTSQAFLLVQDQLARSKEEVAHHQALLEKLQVEKDDLFWREKDINVKNDLVEAFHRLSAAADVRINELETEEQKQLDLRNLIEANKQKAASDEPRRKEIIAEFRELVSSFPGSMGAMQDKIRSFKEAAADVHALRADLHSLSKILDRKAKEFDDLSVRSAEHVAEIAKLQAIVEYLKQSEFELKLIFEMFQRESTDSRDITEARDLEIKAWAHAQNLVASLDEHSLELRVKTANEAEARSQQRLAVAEAAIADLRQKLEACKRNSVRLTDVLKSKHEENEAYLSEIETIGQAYDDMQNQNQQLLQQITERDDYNIKLCLESVRDRQLHEVLLVEKLSMEKAIQQTNSLLDFFDIKAARIEDQLKACEDHIQKLAEERMQNSDTLENAEKKILDVRKPSGQYWELLEGLQLQVGKNRVNGAKLRIELEKERFEKKRIEEELEVSRKKVLRLRAQRDGSSVVGKLNRELKEYREILKCGICFDRPKEVVITKCYHLFCSSCVQKILGTRHRKCPMCSSSFGHNDVKSVYI